MFIALNFLIVLHFDNGLLFWK